MKWSQKIPLRLFKHPKTLKFILQQRNLSFLYSQFSSQFSSPRFSSQFLYSMFSNSSSQFSSPRISNQFHNSQFSISSLWVSRHTVQKFRNHNHGTRCTNKLGKLMEWKPNGKLSKEYHLNTALAVGKCQNVLLAFTMLENTEIAFFINVLTKSAMIKKYKKLINDSFTTNFNKEWIHSKRNPLRTCCVECSDVVAQMVGPVFGLLRVSCK